MSKLANWKFLSLGIVALLSAALSLNLAVAQPKSTAKAKAAAAAVEEEESDEKVKGRLPPYYKEIVDAKQKDEIYKLQADFNAKIDALEDQLKKLITDRDAAVEKILSVEQKGKLKKAKEEAAAKKKKPAKPEAKPAE